MKILVLLAGQSKRFWPLSEKMLFPIAGKTVLEHQLGRLKKTKGDEVILVVNDQNKDAIEKSFPHHEIIVQEDQSLGTRGALLSALPYCGNERVLIVCGNDVVDPSVYTDLLKAADKKGIDGAILGKKMDRYFPGGYLTVEKNLVTSIVEKPGEGNQPSDLVNIEIHVHNDASVLLHELQRIDNVRDDGYEQALATMFQTYRYAYLSYDGVWQPIKFPWHLLHLLPIFLKTIKKPSIHKTAEIHKTSVIEGPVVIEEGVRVLPYACIKGPATIGKGTLIGNNALVRGSSIGKHCVIGYNTEVKDCVLADHVWTHSTYLGDSVIGENVSFGAGSVTGNLRLDEGEIHSHQLDEKIPTGLTKFGAIIGANCRLGIHSSLNPGIKIGAGSFVGSGVLVNKDLPDNTFAVMRNGDIHTRVNNSSAPHPAEREKYRKKI